jgi:hypothetical protein
MLVYHRLTMNIEFMNFRQLFLSNPAWALVIVGILTILVIGWQAVETRRAAQATQISSKAIRQQITVMERQTKATEDAATAAKDSAESTKQSIEMMIGKEQARLRIDLKELNLAAKPFAVYTVDFTVAIDGPTAAYIVETGCVAYVLPLANVDSIGAGNAVINSLSLLPKVISPNSPPLEQFALFIMGDRNAENMISEIKNDRLFVGIRGFIKYKDVFDRNRETRFRYVWKFSNLPFLPETDRFGSWEKCGSEDENVET